VAVHKKLPGSRCTGPCTSIYGWHRSRQHAGDECHFLVTVRLLSPSTLLVRRHETVCKLRLAVPTTPNATTRSISAAGRHQTSESTAERLWQVHRSNSIKLRKKNHMHALHGSATIYHPFRIFLPKRTTCNVSDAI
jgi:hypothetical protein